MADTTHKLRRNILSFAAALLPALAWIWFPCLSPKAMAADDSQAQTRKELSPSVQLDNAADVACRFAAVPYPEGTVLRGDRVPEQMCVRAPNPAPGSQTQGYHAEWIRVSKEAQDRSSQAVVLPGSPDRSMASFCQPRDSEKKGFCGCEGSADFPVGAMARSGKGGMQCGDGGWRPIVSCVAHDVEYPEGTVIRVGESNEQMCARVLNLPFDRQSRETHLDWVRTSKEIRERSAKPVIVMNPVLCKPAPGKGPGLCGCEGFSDFGPNSVMPSAAGPIRCENGEWKPVTNGPPK